MKPSDPPRNESRSHSVETVAGNLLGAAVVFLLLQVVVMVVMMVVAVLLPGLGILTSATGEKLGIACALLAEAVLVTFLVRMVRRNIATQPVGPASPDASPRLEDSPTLERRLERLMIVGAVVGVGASLLMGLGSSAAKIALTVIEAFAALFLLIAIGTRWFLTRRVSTLAVIALCVTLYSLWLAIGPIVG